MVVAGAGVKDIARTMTVPREASSRNRWELRATNRRFQVMEHRGDIFADGEQRFSHTRALHARRLGDPGRERRRHRRCVASAFESAARPERAPLPSSCAAGATCAGGLAGAVSASGSRSFFFAPAIVNP